VSEALRERLGFVGVGAMGSAIASRLVDGYDLWVNDLNPAAATALVERGATFVSLEAIAACPVIFLSLPGPADVLRLLLGDGGLAARMPPGSIIVDTTTSSPIVDEDLAAGLASHGVAYVDSPIAGGVRRAQSGDSTLMVGAGDEEFERVRPYLTSVTEQVFHVGPVGAGHAAKLVNNLLNACNRFAAIETIALAERYGIRRDLIVDVLNVSSGKSYVTEYTYPTLVAAGLRQGFTLELMSKDVRLANELASHVGLDIPLGALVASFVDQAVERIGGSADQTELMTGWYPDPAAVQGSGRE
jgi:3-hydroxyisobutyrate dehydrogenase